MASEIRTEGPVTMQRGLDGSHRPDILRGGLFDIADYEDSSKWMTPLWACSDWNTCCLGWCCPCVLCGKTHWRLTQMKKGRDPLDSGWKYSYGCNKTCAGCLAIQAFVPFTATFAFGYQQNRIREVYSIDGSPITDLLLALVCPLCVNTRNDREIRAREGDMTVKRKSKYSEKSQGGFNAAAAEPIQSPPPRIEPMRYVSPRETSPSSYLQGHQALHEVGNVEPQKPRLAFLKPQKQRKDAVANPQLENKAHATIGALGGLPSMSQESNSEGQITPSVNNQMEHPVDDHGLHASSFMIKNLEANFPPVPYDLVAKRAGVSSDITDIPDTASTQNSLTDSETRDIATSLRGKRSNIGGTGGQELSYVHDFTDCPVSKSVLMYYEKEESKSTRPSTQDDANIKLLSNNPYQYLLSGCQNNSIDNGKHLVITEHSEFSDRVPPFQEPASRSKSISTFDVESEYNQGSSSRPPATRSAEEFEPAALQYDVTPRADKKATSF